MDSSAGKGGSYPALVLHPWQTGPRTACPAGSTPLSMPGGALPAASLAGADSSPVLLPGLRHVDVWAAAQHAGQVAHPGALSSLDKLAHSVAEVAIPLAPPPVVGEGAHLRQAGRGQGRGRARKMLIKAGKNLSFPATGNLSW